MRASRPAQNRQMIKYGVRLSLQGKVVVSFLACLIPALLPWLLQIIPVEIGVVNLLIGDMFLLPVSLPLTALSWVATVLVTDPMRVKLAAFFLTLNKSRENLPSPLSVCESFGPEYGRLMAGMFLRSLRIFLWTAAPMALAALLPGSLSLVSVDGYEALRVGGALPLAVMVSGALNAYLTLVYAMVPYVLSDEPSLTPAGALRRSRELTRGRLIELLVLNLSFLGWMLLVSVTVFIAGIFVYPYLEGTMAAYYLAFTQPPRDGEAEAQHAA